MSRYLLDTSVLSLMAPGRPGVSPALTDWFREHGDALFLCTVTVAEIQQGISKLIRSGAAARAQLLSDWLQALIETGGDRVLTFDATAGLKAGEIADAALSVGRHPGFPDVAIAAIAVARDLTVLTLNGRHFEPLGVRIADPSSPAFLSTK